MAWDNKDGVYLYNIHGITLAKMKFKNGKYVCYKRNKSGAFISFPECFDMQFEAKAFIEAKLQEDA